MKKCIAAIIAALTLISATGCGHKHQFAEATCTQPKTCMECNETEGEPLPHTYSEATCTKPRTCTVCGATEGEALGHEVSIGRCGRCGENVNFDVIEDISNDFQSANKYWDTANQYLSSANTKGSLNAVYWQYCSAYEYIRKYQDALTKIITECEKYPELKKLGSALRDIKYCSISEPAGDSPDELAAFLDRVIEISTLNSIFATEMMNWLNKN